MSRKPRRAQRSIVARGRVGLEARDERTVLLHARRVIRRHEVVEAARAKPLALRHRIHVAHRLGNVALGILLVAEIGRRDRQPRVREAEARILLDRLLETLSRLLETAVRERIHRRRVVAHDFQRCRTQRVEGETLIGVRLVVAEHLAHLGRRAR